MVQVWATRTQSLRRRGKIWARLSLLGNLKDGIDQLLKSENAFLRFFGAQDQRTSQAHLELGIAFKKKANTLTELSEQRQEALLKSLWYFERCLNARRLCFGEHDERVANVYFEMADVKEQQQDIAGAIQDLDICVFIWQKTGKLQKLKKQQLATYERLKKAKADFESKSNP